MAVHPRQNDEANEYFGDSEVGTVEKYVSFIATLRRWQCRHFNCQARCESEVRAPCRQVDR